MREPQWRRRNTPKGTGGAAGPGFVAELTSVAMATPAPPAARQMRPRTTLERQPFSTSRGACRQTLPCLTRATPRAVFAYGAAISLVSPYATLYQLCRLNPQVAITQGRSKFTRKPPPPWLLVLADRP